MTCVCARDNADVVGAAKPRGPALRQMKTLLDQWASGTDLAQAIGRSELLEYRPDNAESVRTLPRPVVYVCNHVWTEFEVAVTCVHAK